MMRNVLRFFGRVQTLCSSKNLATSEDMRGEQGQNCHNSCATDAPHVKLKTFFLPAAWLGHHDTTSTNTIV